jgi:hypothetical protein
VFPGLWNELDQQGLSASLRTALQKRNYPSNARVLRGLETRRFYEKNAGTRGRTTLILETVNRHLSKGTGGYTVLDGPPTIEHVMPQTLSADWQQDLGALWEQVHRDCLHMMGNLTLVTGEWNSGLSNLSFALKQPKLAANALALNSNYFGPGGPTQWGRNEIRERAESLADDVLRLWPSFYAEDSSDEPADVPGAAIASFDQPAIEKVAATVGVPFLKITKARYESIDGAARLVALCSNRYPGGRPFWYGVRPSQRKFLEGATTAWLAFQCEPGGAVVLVPYAVFEPWFKQLRETAGQHWHVDFSDADGRLELLLSLSGQRVDLTPYLLG